MRQLYNAHLVDVAFDVMKDPNVPIYNKFVVTMFIIGFDLKCKVSEK